MVAVYMFHVLSPEHYIAAFNGFSDFPNCLDKTVFPFIYADHHLQLLVGGGHVVNVKLTNFLTGLGK
jgi:hypothetical protein